MSYDAVIAACYHRIEAAILRRAFGLPPEPSDADVDVWGRGSVVSPGVIRLEVPECGSLDEARAVSDAAARLVLSGLEQRLPNYIVRLDTGAIRGARGARRGRRQAVRGMPFMLFGINWADSGPGMSWPEHFHLGWLPGFERWAVTASRDTSEIDGYCDRLLGSFEPCDDPLESACALIQAEWQRQYDDESQERWVEIFGGGRVSSTTVCTMGDVVWGEVDEDGELVDQLDE